MSLTLETARLLLRPIAAEDFDGWASFAADHEEVAQLLGSTRRAPGNLPAPFETVPIEIWGQTREAWREQRRE